MSHVPNILFVLFRMSFWSKFPRIRMPIHATVCTLCFAFALPVAIALFPQESKVIVSSLGCGTL